MMRVPGDDVILGGGAVTPAVAGMLQHELAVDDRHEVWQLLLEDDAADQAPEIELQRVHLAQTVDQLVGGVHATTADEARQRLRRLGHAARLRYAEETAAAAAYPDACNTWKTSLKKAADTEETSRQ